MSTSTTPPEEARAPAPEIPLLGEVPERSNEDKTVIPGKIDEEAKREFRRIADLILHSRRVRGGTIGVLGDVPPEQRAAVAAGLSAAMTSSGTVILVDADIESGCLAVDEREKPQEGFVDVLRYGVRSPRIVTATGTAGLRLLGVGSGTVDVAGTLRAEAMGGLFQALESGADFVVINGPGPLAAGADGLLPRLDSWVLVRGSTSSGNAWIELSGLSRDRCLGRIQVGTPEAAPTEAPPVEAVEEEPPAIEPEPEETSIGDAYDSLVAPVPSTGRGRRSAILVASIVLVAIAGVFGWRTMRGASGTLESLSVPSSAGLIAQSEGDASLASGEPADAAEARTLAPTGQEGAGARTPTTPSTTATESGTKPAGTGSATMARSTAPVAPTKNVETRSLRSAGTKPSAEKLSSASNATVAGTTGAADAGSGKRYVVHVSSVKSEAGANEEASDLKAAGYLTIVRQEAVPGRGTWYRVYLGPYVGREVAERIAGEVRSSGLRDYAQVKRWRKPADGSSTTIGAPTRPSSENSAERQAPDRTDADGGSTGTVAAATTAALAASSALGKSAPESPAARSSTKKTEPTPAKATAANTSPAKTPPAKAPATEPISTTANAPAPSEDQPGGDEGPIELPAWIAEVETSTKISEIGVLEAFPNSTLGRTILYARFTDARTEDVSLTVHDAQGRELTRIDGKLRDGAAMLVWDGTTYDGAAPRAGVYFARLQATETILSTKFEVP